MENESCTVFAEPGTVTVPGYSAKHSRFKDGPVHSIGDRLAARSAILALLVDAGLLLKAPARDPSLGSYWWVKTV